jgi:hypothetical protein
MLDWFFEDVRQRRTQDEVAAIGGEMGCEMKVNAMKLVRIAVGGTIFSVVCFVGTGRGWCQQQPGGGRTNGSAGGSQQQVGTMPPLSGSAPKVPGMKGGIDGPDVGNNDPLAGRMEDQQARSRNMDRQKKLQADTEKLLSLATELKEQVDKTDKNILSVDVIKKADEIEKLAKSVKDRMKG